MLLSCRFLNDVQNVNSFRYTDAIEFYTGDLQNVYIQLIDASVDTSAQGFNPSGRRYMPAAGSQLRVTLQNVDDLKVVYRAGVQAYPTTDPSIWYIPILPSDPLTGTITISAQLVETGGNVHSFANPKGLLLRVR